MPINARKYGLEWENLLKDARPLHVRIADWLLQPTNSTVMFVMMAAPIFMFPKVLPFVDLILFFGICFFLWLATRDRSLPFKLPMGAKWHDGNNEGPGKGGKPEGILYVGNDKDTREELWFTNSDARTHVLYLGTTGAGKTEGLKSMVTNAMAWGSGFVYVDGKADTNLWSSLSSLVRRFGRDDDLLVLNYMTGNSDTKAPSNTMNPFSSGSASYLTNMLVSLMPESEGDNAMWKERAVSLVGALMPALTWKRDNQDIPMSVSTIREYLVLNNVIKLARDEAVPDEIRMGIKGYLDTLPGYVDEVFDDNGQQKPPGPGVPNVDTATVFQQHGYLSMQFTRSLQSLGDDYGYIFDSQAADVDMVDVVLNRRILVVLIPALEKSADETANLGKIVAATLKGMMGSTLGATVEGDSASVIENKPTNSATPFMVVFDEVGYYTAQGMAVMAAQARSLGFCLIYSAQDLPALEKRVKEEARSITANCNMKIFGKLEDPTQTREFFEKSIDSIFIAQMSTFEMDPGSITSSYNDNLQAGVQAQSLASYDDLKGMKEGEACITFSGAVCFANMFYSNPGDAKAMRVTRFMSLEPHTEEMLRHAGSITRLRDKMVKKDWTARKADVDVLASEKLEALIRGMDLAGEYSDLVIDKGICALCEMYALDNAIDLTPPPEPVKKAPKPKVADATVEEKTGSGDSEAKSPLASVAGAKAVDKPVVLKEDALPVSGVAKAVGEKLSEAVKSKSDVSSDSKTTQVRADEPADPMSFFGGGNTKVTTEAKAAVVKTKDPVVDVQEVSKDTNKASSKDVLNEKTQAMLHNAAKATGDELIKGKQDDA